jgi:hypothetical protein
LKYLSSGRDDKKQAPASASMSRNVVQAGAAFSMKDKVADSLGWIVSAVGLFAVLFSAMFFSQYIGFLPALALSAIVYIALILIAGIKHKRTSDSVL